MSASAERAPGGLFTTEAARANNRKRWDSPESRIERAEKLIQKLVDLAPPLTPSQKAKLRPLLKQGA